MDEADQLKVMDKADQPKVTPNDQGRVLIFIDRSNLEMTFRKNVDPFVRIDYVRFGEFFE
jgi:hypothetical protein